MSGLSAGRVLVTGANGFIGSHLTEALIARGYQVRCMVRRSSDLTHIRTLPVEWALADLAQPESLRQACRGVDAVCHCAGITRALDEATFLRINALPVRHLAQTCAEENPALSRFLLLSSMAAAGPSAAKQAPIDEARPPAPLTWYGKSKLEAERALLQWADRLPVTIVRPVATFGPRDRDFLAYFRLAKLGLSPRLGRSERLASLIYVHDLVSLLLLVLEDSRAVGQTYFGTAEIYPFTDIYAAISSALGTRSLSVTLPMAILTPIAMTARVQAWLTGRPALLNSQRVIDLRQPYWTCSGEKARTELGFAAHHELRSAMQQTAAWYAANGWL